MRPEGILVAFLWLLLTTAALTVIAALAVALRPLGRGLTASYSPAKAMLFCGALLLVLCGLFPPWVYSYSGQVVGSAGFHFLFTPPVAIQVEVKLDMNQLAIEWICVLVSTTAVWMLLGKSHQEQG